MVMHAVGMPSYVGFPLIHVVFCLKDTQGKAKGLALFI